MRSISRLKEEISIVDVLDEIGVYVPYRSGWVSVRCPFHGDRTASAGVNPIDGRFKCHACDAQGDIIDLAKLHLDTDELRVAKDWLEKTFISSP